MEQSTGLRADSTIDYQLLDLQKNAAEMQAAGTGQEGAALLQAQTEIRQLQSQIQLESGGSAK